MSSVPSLYRRHRPRTFADVVGQEPVVRTLRHAVERGKVHHAYLFVGSRGTGKTSMAKILAACLNCEQGPTIEPCGVCEACRAIASATSLDVIEMDAASNNSVDDIRDLRDSVAYAPVSGRHKVYILDEAHMLSSAAWNAFLKTLEEPPPNTIFVLATTEAQKVPATVVDRCHRFNFQRPSVEQIAGVVRRAADAESIEIPQPAVAAIARSATGSFRDALGTLEQLVTYSGQSVVLEDVLAVLGVADAELLAEAFEAVAESDARRALLAVHRCAQSGRDAGSFIVDLETHARALMVVQTLGQVPAELSVTPESDARLAAQAERLPREAVVRVLDLLGSARDAVRAGADPRTQLELALIKAATPEVDGSTHALLARVERLESALAGGRPGAAPRRSRLLLATHRPALRRTPIPILPRALLPARRHLRAAGRGPVRAARRRRARGPRRCRRSARPGGRFRSPLPDLAEMQALWPAVLDAIRGADNALLAALLADARPVELAGGELRLAFPSGSAFLKKKAEDQANRVAVSQALRAVTGHSLRLAYELREDLGEWAPAVPAPSEEEWVARFVAEFDAEELPVQAQEGE